jgi:hypothetical protein
MLTVTARSLKCVAVLDATTVLNVECPEGGSARTLLTVRLPDRTLTADLASKSIRKVQAAIDQYGVEGVAVVLQGRLAAGNAGDQLVDAGIAQAKAPKADPAAEAA